MEHLPGMGESSGSDIPAEEQPIYDVNTEDGLQFELTLANTVVREFGKGYKFLDHIYYLGSKVDPDDVDPFRLYGHEKLRQELVAAGYNHVVVDKPTKADEEYYNLFEKSQLKQWDQEYGDKLIGE
jgi:hypothetical protein